jgi:Holliday junction DNA helicase RuvA
VIGKITGRVDYVAEDHALIEAGGIGYVVFAATATLGALRPGAMTALYTELVVREDSLTLYGFATLAEREWHRLLTSVQGVGARLGLAILGALGSDAVGRALALGDATAIRAAPGVGPKLAARIVNELKDRAPTVMALGAAGARPAAAADALVVAEGGGETPQAAPAEATVPAGPGATAEAMSALANLGYGPGEAAAAIAEAASDGAAYTAALIRAALRTLAPKG